MTEGDLGKPGKSGGAPDGGFAPDPSWMWAERAADLVLANEVLPGPAAAPDLVALRGRFLRRRTARRAAWAGFSLTAVAALGTVVVMAIGGPSPRMLSYVVDGTSWVNGDTIEAPPAPAHQIGPVAAQGETHLRFSEGTAITLSPGARLRVHTRTAAGAQLVLDQGRASFAVVHRPAADWRVKAGPFVVEVTGTRFSLDWAATQGRLTLDLESGGVIVRGDAAGPGVAVGPGERLTASMANGRVTVESRAKASVPNTRERAAAPPVSGPPAGPRAAADPVMQAPVTQASVTKASGPFLAAPAFSGAVAVAAESGGTASPPARAVGAGETARPSRSRSRSLKLAVASPGGGAPDRRTHLQPPPVSAPMAPSLLMGGGGVFCAGEQADLGFEQPEIGVSIPAFYHLAFSSPRTDATHSWCGTRSQRLTVNFTERGRANFMGRLPHQSGQVVIRLPRLMDFTDKTVSLHMFIEGPNDARVAAQLFVIHHGKWVNGPVVDHLVPRRWWTISHTFKEDNPLTVGPPYPPAGTSRVTDCDRIALIVYSTGGPRTWSGAIYLDEVGWK